MRMLKNNNKEIAMSSTITVGKRLIPLEQIALIEPFDAAARARLESDRPFQARIVLLDRESVLTEEALAAFAGKHAFRVLSEDGIAANPAVHFSVEAFEPAEGFKPTKPYRSRLLWRDQDGQVQSKLLLAEPEIVLSIVVRGAPEPPATGYPAGAARSRRPQASSFRPK
jgi:hypothetical protein